MKIYPKVVGVVDSMHTNGFSTLSVLRRKLGKEKVFSKAEIMKENIKEKILLSLVLKLNPLADDFSFLSFKTEKIACAIFPLLPLFWCQN